MQQMDAIRRGMNRVVPVQLLDLLTWSELEASVCGAAFIDVEMLRRHTIYSKGVDPDAPHIRWFWDALTQFSQVRWWSRS